MALVRTFMHKIWVQNEFYISSYKAMWHFVSQELAWRWARLGEIEAQNGRCLNHTHIIYFWNILTMPTSSRVDFPSLRSFDFF